MYSLNIMYAKKTWFSALTDTTRGSESQLTAGIIAVYYVGDGIRFTLLTVIFWKVECEAVKINHYWLGSKLFLSSLLSFHFVPWENVSCSVATNHSSLPLLLLPFSPSLPPFLSSNERQKAIIKSQKADGCWCLAADDWQLMLSSWWLAADAWQLLLRFSLARMRPTSDRSVSLWNSGKSTDLHVVVAS